MPPRRSLWTTAPGSIAGRARRCSPAGTWAIARVPGLPSADRAVAPLDEPVAEAQEDGDLGCRHGASCRGRRDSVEKILRAVRAVRHVGSALAIKRPWLAS